MSLLDSSLLRLNIPLEGEYLHPSPDVNDDAIADVIYSNNNHH